MADRVALPLALRALTFLLQMTSKLRAPLLRRRRLLRLKATRTLASRSRQTLWIPMASQPLPSLPLPSQLQQRGAMLWQNLRLELKQASPLLPSQPQRRVATLWRVLRLELKQRYHSRIRGKRSITFSCQSTPPSCIEGRRVDRQSRTSSSGGRA